MPITTDAEPNTAGTSGEVSMVCLTGVCYQSLGQFRSAVSQFSKALLLDQTSCCWYQREVALFIWSRLDKSLKTFNLDSEVDPRIKDGWCKRASWRHILPSASSHSSFPPNERYVPLTQPKQVSGFDENPPSPPDHHSNSTEKPQILPPQSPTLSLPRPVSSKQEAIEKLLHFTAPYGEWLQLRCPGFLPNIRQVSGACSILLLLLLALRSTFSDLLYLSLQNLRPLNKPSPLLYPRFHPFYLLVPSPNPPISMRCLASPLYKWHKAYVRT
jgi:tetratricopeptide (TPR) repeat protein